MPDHLVFVNYQNPVMQSQDRRLRRIVATHIGTHYRNRSRPSKKESSSKKEIERQSNRTRSVTLDHHSFEPPTPSLSFFKGNSDPFSSYSVNVDPYISGVITFYESVAAPAMSEVSPRGWTFWQTPASAKRDSSNALCEPSTAYGFLARAATMASKLTPSLLPRALNLLGQSMSSLTQTLEAGQTLHSQANYIQAMVLFSTEVLAGNQVAAAIHGKMLKTVFDTQKNLQSTNLIMLRYVLFMDGHFSAIFLVRSVFDIERWYTEDTGSFDIFPTPMLDVAHDHFDKEVHNSITETDIYGLLLDTRHVISLWQQYCCGQIAPSENWHLRLFYKIHICQQRVINLYLSASEPGSVHKVMRRCVLLAMLIWLRKLIFQFRMGGLEVYDAIPQILNRVHQNILLVKEQDDYHPEVSPQMLFWILFSAAQAEQDAKEQGNLVPGSFSEMLLTKSHVMDVLTWESAVDITKQFVFSDLVMPHGAVWFPSLMKDVQRSGRPSS